MGTPPDSEGGRESNWQRPQEGEWKQAPDGSWYKDAGPAPERPSGPAPQQQWAPPGQAQWPPSQVGGDVVPPAPSSGKATASLILGIAGIFFCPLVCAVLALVFGYQARGEIDRSGGAVGGRGQATAGIVLGWIGVGLVVLLIGLIVLGLTVGDSGGTSTEFHLN